MDVEDPPTAGRRATGRAFGLIALISLLILYGSLYPFHFVAVHLDAARIIAFVRSISDRDGAGDLVGNIVLFVPLGLAGTLFGSGRRRWAALLPVAIWGILLAAGTQFAQIWLPSRVASLDDVAWNLVGLALGLASGRALLPCLFRHAGRFALPPLTVSGVPLLLAGCWLGYSLAPFVPSLDLQSLKDSLKPLLLHPSLTTGGVVRSTIGWMAFACFWRTLRPGRTAWPELAAIVVVVFGLKVLVVNNVVSASNVAGVALGLTAWALADARRLAPPATAAALAAGLGYLGLEPFALRAAAPFHWIPFYGFLNGSMYVNGLNLLLKTGLYGALFWILVQMRLGRGRAALAVAGYIGAIEVAQTHIAGRLAEIADPLLVLLVAALMYLVGDAGPGRRPKRDVAQRPAPCRAGRH